MVGEGERENRQTLARMRGNWDNEQPCEVLLANRGAGEWRKHPTAEVSVEAEIWPGVVVWRWSHVRENAKLHQRVSIGQSCYVAEGVEIGEDTRIGNHVSVWTGVTIGKRVFVGPGVTFTNDPNPVAGDGRFEPTATVIEDDVSIGAGAQIRCGLTLGRGARIGMGATVTHDVLAGELWRNEPARMVERGR